MMGRYARLGFLRGPGDAERERVHAALSVVGMADSGDRQIGALSGGQRRRVFLARAIAADPDLYLLDEPVTGVDAGTQEDLMAVLEAQADAGKTVIATTHDLITAAERFHQAALLNGRLLAYGPADLVLDGTSCPRPMAVMCWSCPAMAGVSSSTMHITTTTP